MYSYAEKKDFGAEDGLCTGCNEADIRQWHLGHRDQSIRWARELVDGANFLVLDSETTALDGELVEIAVLRPDGTTALDTLLKPSGPMGATEIHGITEEMVAGAPTFAVIEPVLRTLLTGIAGRRVVVYNASFDRGILEREVFFLRRQECPPAQIWEGLMEPMWTSKVGWECLMEAYAPYYGDWSERHGSYTWQPLSGNHRAVGDCRQHWISCTKWRGRRCLQRRKIAMPIPPEQKTNVGVKRRIAQGRDTVAVSLASVRTGPSGDNSFTVEMWLTPGEARKLRDDLTQALAEGPK